MPVYNKGQTLEMISCTWFWRRKRWSSPENGVRFQKLPEYCQNTLVKPARKLRKYFWFCYNNVIGIPFSQVLRWKDVGNTPVHKIEMHPEEQQRWNIHDGFCFLAKFRSIFFYLWQRKVLLRQTHRWLNDPKNFSHHLRPEIENKSSFLIVKNKK